MIESTLCYIEKDGAYLMLHRVKKKQDANAGKWIGVGGKLEAGETRDACVLREVCEETGLTLTDFRFRGEIRFVSDVYPEEMMYLYHATGFTGTLGACDEGELRWIPKTEIDALNLWEGDRAFLPLVDWAGDAFAMTLSYRGDTLISVETRPLIK